MSMKAVWKPCGLTMRSLCHFPGLPWAILETPDVSVAHCARQGRLKTPFWFCNPPNLESGSF